MKFAVASAVSGVERPSLLFNFSCAVVGSAMLTEKPKQVPLTDAAEVELLLRRYRSEVLDCHGRDDLEKIFGDVRVEFVGHGCQFDAFRLRCADSADFLLRTPRRSLDRSLCLFDRELAILALLQKAEEVAVRKSCGVSIAAPKVYNVVKDVGNGTAFGVYDWAEGTDMHSYGGTDTFFQLRDAFYGELARFLACLHSLPTRWGSTEEWRQLASAAQNGTVELQRVCVEQILEWLIGKVAALKREYVQGKPGACEQELDEQWRLIERVQQCVAEEVAPLYQVRRQKYRPQCAKDGLCAVALIHEDFHAKHFIVAQGSKQRGVFDGEKWLAVSAVVDWSDPALADIAVDLRELWQCPSNFARHGDADFVPHLGWIEEYLKTRRSLEKSFDMCELCLAQLLHRCNVYGFKLWCLHADTDELALAVPCVLASLRAMGNCFVDV
ncbi:unnamed protein product [Effrenium voratum]|nr:unnamed protein product [Effrenium voratum]